MPVKYSCEGNNVSPALHIEHIPVGTRTLAIIVHDPDASKPGGITHWVVWNIEPASEIAEQYTGVFQGKNSEDKAVYMGPCPPSGTHHYHFRVYALDARMDVPAGITGKAGLEQAMQGHILAEGLLTGLYRKRNAEKP
jgi:Raf kinase inhibitor-like YbhB/YbcL family protein